MLTIRLHGMYTNRRLESVFPEVISKKCHGRTSAALIDRTLAQGSQQTSSP
jgi:hypothetical protein